MGLKPIAVHRALRIVERVEMMWESDRNIAGDRARLIVQRLIETGHLYGEMKVDMPLECSVTDPSDPSLKPGFYWVRDKGFESAALGAPHIAELSEFGHWAAPGVEGDCTPAVVICGPLRP